MKLFWRFSILICAAASALLGMHIGDIQHTAAGMVGAAAPVRYDVTYYRDGEKVTAENVLVSFDGDTAALSNGETVSVEFSEFTSRNSIRAGQNRTRTGVLSLLLIGIAAAAISAASAFAVRSMSAYDAGQHRAARRNVTRINAQRGTARRAA